MYLIACIVLLSCCCTTPTIAQWDQWLEDMPQSVLDPVYHPTCHKPCEYIGFSFSGPRSELLQMKATGANAAGLGAMWHPIEDQDAPYGCGISPPGGAGQLGQTFAATEPFDAVAPSLPTGFTEDSGCSWRLYECRGEERRAEIKARGTWRYVEDNSRPPATFEECPPGRYYFEITEPTGSWIGWWAVPEDPYEMGTAFIADDRRPGLDFELRIRTGGDWTDVIKSTDDHRAIHLGPPRIAPIDELDMRADYSVGNWNNPGFPYYPDWFIERFPGSLAVDQHGNHVLGGMFDERVPAPGIESPVIVDGTSRFIRATVRRMRDYSALLYWVMGGEALYATYLNRSQWTDYSDNAIRHFRAWLQDYRYQTIDGLNDAWETDFGDFASVEPPRQPAVTQRWLDWLDFRFASMAERFAWHYRATRSEDPQRLILTCNHGTLYHGNSYAAMGARPELYAAVCDGFETGQIMSDTDPTLYNIMYMESLNGLGKPYCPRRLAYKKSDPTARGGGTSYTPEAARRYIYESLGGDAWHLGLIQWSGSLPDGEWGVVGTPAEKEIKKAYHEIRSIWPLLEDMHAVKPKLGVFLSHPTWALKGFSEHWAAFHVAAVEHHVPKLYVYEEQLKAGRANGHEIVLSIDNAIIAPAVLRALSRYVEAGGHLVIAGRFADQWLTEPDDETIQIADSLRAEATIVDSTQPQDILDALGSRVRPIDFSTDSRVTRTVEKDIAPGATDWPQDLTSAESLGQTITLPHDGLSKVALRMPTYVKTPEHGFRFEVRAGGPEGELLAARDVPGGIADNSWQEITIDPARNAGDVLYLKAIGHAELQPLHLGWWSTRDNPYPDGTAYIDDEPVEGDRHVRMTFQRPVPAARAIETFLLSDGLNYGIVVINLADESVPIDIDASKLVPAERADDYSIRAPIMPESWQSIGLRGTLQLPGHGATFLYATHQTTEKQATDLLNRARGACDQWRAKDAMTPFAEYAIDKADIQLRAGRFSKAAAMALKVLTQMGMQLDVESRPGSLSITGRCFDPSGDPASLDRVLCQFVPTKALYMHPDIGDEGQFALRIDSSELPRIYDYARGHYRSYSGPLRLQISAHSTMCHTQRIADVVIGP